MKLSEMIGTFAIAGTMLLGCGPSGTQVKRSDEAVDLSGEWNDVDADMVAKAMIKDCLDQGWAGKHKAKSGKPPVVKFYPMRNKSSEHINEEYFTKQVERALINSGDVEVVAGKKEAGDAREEQADQGKHASDETMKSAGNETGADYILNGWIVSQNDTDGAGKTIKAFLTTMELTDVQSQKKVWIGEKKIKKQVQQAGSSF